MADKPIVGFIGVGLMGHGMAKNILEGGYALRIKGNRNRQPVEDLVKRGATEARSAREIAETCDIVHICLSNSPQVEAIVRGEDGILASGKAGLIVVDCTTSDPASTDALAAELAAAGMVLVDAPLGRTPKEAEEGTLDAMVGCDEKTLGVVRPVIECWAGSVTHIGATGTAHRMKLIMNFIAMGYGALFAEALSLGTKAGVAPQTIRDVMGASRMSNGFFDTFMSYAVDRNRDAHKFTITNALKDMTYVASMAQGAGVMNPIGAAARNYYAHVAAIGEGADYVPMVADHVARLNGFDLAEEVAKARG